MSTFRFNFSKSDEEVKHEEKTLIEWAESEEVKLEKQISDLDVLAARATMFTYEDVEIGHVLPSEVLNCLINTNNEVFAAESNHSDLVAGKYEGGLKIWECTSDLLEYLIRNKETIVLSNSKVLDLGCGAGLLGIYAFLEGSHVTFQDYNKEVLQSTTIPNVLLNIEEELNRPKEIARCRFFCGDWASFNTLLDDEFDVILTSETIYNTSNYDKLIEVFTKKLTPGGTAYVAAKCHYFGVGGGTRQFEAHLDKCGGFRHEVCWTNETGIQREIIKVSKICT